MKRARKLQAQKNRCGHKMTEIEMEFYENYQIMLTGEPARLHKNYVVEQLQRTKKAAGGI